jgi:hypothetical protein
MFGISQRFFSTTRLICGRKVAGKLNNIQVFNLAYTHTHTRTHTEIVQSNGIEVECGNNEIAVAGNDATTY